MYDIQLGFHHVRLGFHYIRCIFCILHIFSNTTSAARFASCLRLLLLPLSTPPNSGIRAGYHHFIASDLPLPLPLLAGHHSQEASHRHFLEFPAIARSFVAGKCFKSDFPSFLLLLQPRRTPLKLIQPSFGPKPPVFCQNHLLRQKTTSCTQRF